MGIRALRNCFSGRSCRAWRWSSCCCSDCGPRQRRQARDGIARTARPWTLRPFDRSFRLYLVALVVFTLGNSSDLFLLTRAGELGVASGSCRSSGACSALAKSGGNMFAGRVVDRVGPRPMILVGWLFYAAIYLAFALATAAWHIWVLFFAYAIFYALTEPAEKTLVANLVGQGASRAGLRLVQRRHRHRHAAGQRALRRAVRGFGPLVAFGSGAGLALAAAVLLWRLCRP